MGGGVVISHEDLRDEAAYDRLRLAQWRNGQAHAKGLSRRELIRLSTGASLATVTGLTAAAGVAMPTRGRSSPAAVPIVKPLPPELFYLHGSNAGNYAPSPPSGLQNQTVSGTLFSFSAPAPTATTLDIH